MSKNREKIQGINPFLASLTLKPVTIHTKWTVSGGNAGLVNSLSIPSYVDPSRGSWYNIDFGVLHQYSSSALRVFGYILGHLRWNQDYIELKPDIIGMTKTPFYNGISELIERGIIADRPTRKSTYWINPDQFFHGSRFKAFPDNIIKNEPDFPAESSSNTPDQSLF